MRHAQSFSATSRFESGSASTSGGWHAPAQTRLGGTWMPPPDRSASRRCHFVSANRAVSVMTAYQSLLESKVPHLSLLWLLSAAGILAPAKAVDALERLLCPYSRADFLCECRSRLQSKGSKHQAIGAGKRQSRSQDMGPSSLSESAEIPFPDMVIFKRRAGRLCVAGAHRANEMRRDACSLAFASRWSSPSWMRPGAGKPSAAHVPGASSRPPKGRRPEVAS